MDAARRSIQSGSTSPVGFVKPALLLFAILLLVFSGAQALAVPMTYSFDPGGPLSGSFVNDPALASDKFLSWDFSDTIGQLTNSLPTVINNNTGMLLSVAQTISGNFELIYNWCVIDQQPNID